MPYPPQGLPSVCPHKGRIFLPAYGYVWDSTTASKLTYKFNYSCHELTDGQYGYSHYTFEIPQDWSSVSKLYFMWSSPSAGSIVADVGGDAAGDGEDLNGMEPGTTLAQVFVSAGTDKMNIDELTLVAASWSSLAPGDIIGLRFRRTGGSGTDTLNDVAHIYGLLVVYNYV